MLKKVMIGVLALIVLISIIAITLYFRLSNDIENILIANEDWRSEVLEFPLIFANDLEYDGEEHVRFAPGWGKEDQEDYFSYVFVWLLEENPNLTSSILENNMNIYFDFILDSI